MPPTLRIRFGRELGQQPGGNGGFSLIYSVRRESRRSPVGANSIRPIGRSAGSNQSDEGGNEFVEVLW